MSRRPQYSGLPKDTFGGRVDSRGFPSPGLSSDITSIRRGDYPGIVRFIDQHPWITDKQEIDKLLTRASDHETAGESDLAETCVHHALALRKWRHRRLQEARKYFESLAEGGETYREFKIEVTKQLALLPQKSAYGPTATEITRSRTPVFRENDDRLRPCYTESQGNSFWPASNRQNPDPSRTLSDLDRNIREHGRTLVRYDTEPSIRHRQESPNSTSRYRPQGEPELPLKSYFLPTEGINYDVIQRDLTQHLGATASVKLGVHDVSFRKRGQRTSSRLRRVDQDTSSKRIRSRQS